jgi:hypothetical protein
MESNLSYTQPDSLNSSSQLDMWFHYNVTKSETLELNLFNVLNVCVSI